MNEATVNELRIIVERVVRPLKASAIRKNRIREEMLAHVIEAFEAEFARNNNEFKSLELTRRRFGEPALIVSQLQSAIPKRDSWYRLLETRADETMLRAGIKFVAIELCVYFAILTAGFWMTNAFGGMSGSEALTLVGTMSFVPVWAAMPIWLFGVVVVMCIMEDAILKSDNDLEWPPRKVNQFLSTAWCYWPVRLALLVAPASMLAMGLIPGLHWPASIHDWNVATFAMVGLGACGLGSLAILCGWVLAMTVQDRRKQQQAWASLPVDPIAQ